MLSAFIILSIAVAIYLGYKTQLNTGLFCIVFAYIIGCLVMGLKPKNVIAFWPISTMFVILSVSLFYNIAAINGTLEKMSGSLLYACRKFPGMLPFALFAVAVILSVMGATYFTVLAFLAPITLVICDESRMDKLTGAVAINSAPCARGLSYLQPGGLSSGAWRIRLMKTARAWWVRIPSTWKCRFSCSPWSFPLS